MKKHINTLPLIICTIILITLIISTVQTQQNTNTQNAQPNPESPQQNQEPNIIEDTISESLSNKLANRIDSALTDTRPKIDTTNQLGTLLTKLEDRPNLTIETWGQRRTHYNSSNKNFNITLANHIIKRLELRGVTRGDNNRVSIDEKVITSALQSYAIDPTNINFTNGTIEVTAKGRAVYKCPTWNFDLRTCETRCEIIDNETIENETNCAEPWQYLQDITPGEPYTITITPNDPAFLETAPAADVALAPLNKTHIIIGYVNSADNDVEFRIMHTNGSILVNTTDVDTSADTVSRVSVAPINTTHFVIAWIDGPSDDLTHAIYHVNGSLVFGPSDADTDVGTNTDVSVTQLGDRYALCYANDADDDADFQMFLNNGTSAVGETAVDTDIAPGATLQNLVGCSAINSTRWSYIWFDDASNDATYNIRSDTGASISGPTDTDTVVGETGQVASASLNGDRVALVWYDSTDDDITVQLRSSAGAIIAGRTDIDTNAGTDSRVSVTNAHQNSTSTSDVFVAAWYDQASSDIKAAVYNSTLGTITAPFSATTAINTTFPLLHVAARDPITNQSICPGTFILAHSNSTSRGEYIGYFLNGTRWDGDCPELNPPRVTNIGPVNGTVYSRNASVSITASVTDDTRVTTVRANITLPNGTINTINLTFNNVTGRYQGTFINTSTLGSYFVQFIATDKFGNVNSTRNLTILIQVANVTLFTKNGTNATRGGPSIFELLYNVQDQVGVPPLEFNDQKFIFNDTINQFSPQTVITTTDTILIVYHEDSAGDENIRLVRSTTDGDTFSAPITVSASPTADENNPNIAVFGSTVWIVYQSNNGSGIDLFLRNSTNDGLSWNAPIQITNTSTISEGEPSLERDPSGRIFVIYEAIIAPDTDTELYLINSTNFVTWSNASAPLQLTNNTYNDYDPDALQSDNLTYITWAPEFPDFQEIFISSVANIVTSTPGAASSNQTQITDNDFYDFEPSVQINSEGRLFVSWVTLINISQVAFTDPLRTSNEIFVATGLTAEDRFIEQSTLNNVSDTYPGLVQQGSSGFFFNTWMRENGGDMDLIFARRTCTGGDAINVTARDRPPANLTVINASITDNGTLNGSQIIWIRDLQFSGESTDLVFAATANASLPLGTVITNTANLTYYTCNGQLISIINSSTNITIVNEPPFVYPNASLINISYLLDQNATIQANITDPFENISVGFAIITAPNGTNTTINLTNQTSIYTALFSQIALRGHYNITFFGNDTLNAINFTEISGFNRVSRNGTFDIINLSDFNYLNYTTEVIQNISGILNISANISGKRIKKANVVLHDSQSPLSILRIDDETPFNRTPPGSFVAYGIDPTSLNFTNMTLTINATGDDSVWKCDQYNLTDRDCFPGDWAAIAQIEPGQPYNITIDPTDPGFLETSVAADVSLAPINNTAFIAAFVNASGGTISFLVLNTNGTILANGPVTPADNTSRVSVDIINTTHFAIIWADGTTNSLEAAVLAIDGTVVIGPATLDATIGTSTDVSTQLLDHEAAVECYANDDDNDADFLITNSTPPGAILVSETSIDGNIAPGAPLQNLIECAGNTNELFTYFWFDDSLVNDATFAVISRNGTTIAGPTDIDTDIGETGQVAATALNDNATALLWYDSTDDDVTFAIVNLSGSTLAGPTDIDTDAGVLSRVSIATIQETATSTNDLFVAVYSDANDVQIEAAVFYSNGSTYTSPFVVTTQPNVTALLHDVTALDTITNQSICPGRFIVAFSNSSGAGEFLGFYLNGTPWNGICETDLLPLNITFNSTYPAEGELVNISSTILNNGTSDAVSFIVQYKTDNCTNGTQINGNITIPSLAAGANTTVNVTYLTTAPGPVNISVCVDASNTVTETNETNNNITRQLNVSAYHFFYGTLGGNVTLDTAQNNTLYDWNFTDAGNVYFTDSDQTINFANLLPLGQNISLGIATTDFSDADAALGMTGFNDSIEALFGLTATFPRTNTTFTVRGKTLNTVPIINTTSSSAFITGILWDYTNDTTGEFDAIEREPLVFIGNINRSTTGSFGTYDYEIRVPALLRNYTNTTTQLAYYAELR